MLTATEHMRHHTMQPRLAALKKMYLCKVKSSLIISFIAIFCVRKIIYVSKFSCKILVSIQYSITVFSYAYAII